MSIIFCKTPDEVLLIKGSQKIKFFCKSCGKEVIRTVKSSSKQRLSRLLCTKCSYTETCMSKYGYQAFTQSTEFKSKAQTTMLAKYGGKCTAQSAVLQEKCKQTNLKKYGAEFPFGSSIVKNKSKQTFQAKYGKNSYVETDSFKSKAKQTLLKHFGVDSSMKSEQVKEKAKQTMRAKYGVDWYTQTGKIGNSVIHYKYNNIIFDSSWELAFYIYCIDHKKDIQHEPFPIIYQKDGKDHKYYPDFLVDGKLYEIKGDYFFDDNNNLINPYKKELLLEKQNCMIANNVTIISSQGIEKYLSYVYKTYGKNYLNQFKEVSKCGN